MPAPRDNLLGIFAVIGASFFFSFNDMAMKFLSGGYALHEVVLVRSLVGMVVIFALILPFEGGFAMLRTKRLGLHILRGVFVFFANMTFFLALAAMPLADAVAIFFVSPLVITVFSVVFLGETVGPHRWFAVGIGLLGVIIIIRPGSDSFQYAALLPLAAAVFYAALAILTRKIGGTERAGTMTFYVQLTFLVASLAIGLVAGQGQFAGSGDASLDFLLRAWVWPDQRDFWIMALIGVSSTFGGYLLSQAYRKCEAALAAPFEYSAMILAIFWGVMVFGEWPDRTAWIGISLIIFGGLYMLWREAVHKTKPATTPRLG